MPSLVPLLGSRLWQGSAPISRSGGWATGSDKAAHRAANGCRTGFDALDQSLPDGGWPLGALTEILSDQQGVGELRLVMSTLADITQAGRWVVWVAPPYIPYAPALEAQGIVLSRVLWIGQETQPKKAPWFDYLWAAEQALRQPACGAVLVWMSNVATNSQNYAQNYAQNCDRGGEGRVLRKLQIAAEAGSSWGVLFRPTQVAKQPSPAALRLQLEASSAGTKVKVLKCRGRAPSEFVMTL